MKSSCSEFERFYFEPHALRLPEAALVHWQQHVQSCPACRAQWRLHVQLQHILPSSPHPQVPQNFSSVVLAYAQERQSARVVAKRVKVWLVLYWFAALLGSLYVLHDLRWPAWRWSGYGVALVFALVPVSFFMLSYAHQISARLLRFLSPLLH